MKEQDLRDIFHAYRPNVGDNDEFMDRLTAQMDAADARKQPRIIPLYRRALSWAVGIAACIAILVGSVALLRNLSTSETNIVADLEEPEAKPQDIKPVEQEVPQMQETPFVAQVVKPETKVPKKRHKKRPVITEVQNTVSENNLPSAKTNEETVRVAQPITASVPDPFIEFEDQARDIRSRGERLHQEIAMLMNNQ